MELLILIGIISGFVALYVGTLYLNSRVAVPESCKEAYLEAQACESCASRSGQTCGFSQALEFMKEVKL
mgnify:CR=1 FL=1